MGGVGKRILAFWRPHRWLAAGLLVTMLLKTVFTVVLAFSMKLIIDAVVEADSDTSVVMIGLLLVVGFVISAVAGIANGYLAARAGADILAEVRTALYDRLQEMSLAFHRGSSSGDLLARFSSDIAQLSGGVIKQPVAALTSMAAIVFYVPVMLTLELRLGLLAVVAMPLAVYLVNKFAPDTDTALDEEKRQIGGVLSEVSENLRAQPVIRAFGLQKRSKTRFLARINQLHATSSKAEFRVHLLANLSEYSIAFVQVVVVAFGAALAIGGSLEAGTLAAFVALLVEFTWETTVIGRDVLPETRKAWSGIRRIDELLVLDPGVQSGDISVAAPQMDEGIRFEGVGFQYSLDDPPQLSNVTFDVASRTFVAIVGASGSGKSTLLSLLLRFQDPNEGRVLIDSVDISRIDPVDLRSTMGVVLQETFLFNESLRQNIALANPAASSTELELVLESVGLAEVVQSLPDGLETVVGEGGRPLSGGQSQRVGLARALLRDPRLLLLDEATSALDPATEIDVLQTIEQTRRDRTVVMVTHRLQSVVNADRIVVMRGGIVDEIGTFDELIEADGSFASMWRKQQGFSISGDGRAASLSADRLGAIPLFADLPESQLERLAGEFSTQQVEQDSIVFEEGQLGDRFYVIVRGVVEVLVATSGESRVIAHLEDGDFFGEMALLDDAPRNATITAVTPTTLLSVGRDRFEVLLEDSPELARAVREVAGARAAVNGGT